MTKFDELPFIADRETYWRQVAGFAADRPSLTAWAEFGVAGGRSCHYWLEAMAGGDRLYAFDSWQGLPEAWDKGSKVMPAGTFAQNIPAFLFGDPRVVVKAGWFTETLPVDFGGPLALCHIDSDLYSSAATVLEHVDPYLQAGTVLAFDEIWNWGDTYPKWREGEWLAYREWEVYSGKRLRWLTATVGGACGVIV